MEALAAGLGQTCAMSSSTLCTITPAREKKKQKKGRKSQELSGLFLCVCMYERRFVPSKSMVVFRYRSCRDPYSISCHAQCQRLHFQSRPSICRVSASINGGMCGGLSAWIAINGGVAAINGGIPPLRAAPRGQALPRSPAAPRARRHFHKEKNLKKTAER
eukprot:25870-Rhodomonas_salina.2